MHPSTRTKPETATPSAGSRGATPLRVGAVSALAAALAVALSAPSLARPLPEALGLSLVTPLVLGLGLGLCGATLVPRFLRERLPRVLPTGAALLAALPWIAVAAAPMARGASGVVAALAAVVLAGALGARGGAAVSALFAVAAALVLALVPAPSALGGERSVVVLGFDAATWDQIDPMIEAGELPAFARLRDEGVTGVLRSDEVTQSPRLWSTIATGVPPEEHGIRAFGFDRSYFEVGRMWVEAMDRGRRAGVVGWLITSPPDPGLSFSTPGWVDAQDAVLPAEARFVSNLENHLLAARPARERLRALAFDALSAFAISRADDVLPLLAQGRAALRAPNPYWRTMLITARLKTSLFLELVDRERPEYAALVTYPTDSLGHRYWKYHEPELDPELPPEDVARYGQVVRDAYREADLALGRVLDRVDPARTTVIVTSDHGMKGIPREERGLVIRSSVLPGVMGMEDELEATNHARNLSLTARAEGEEGQAVLERAFELLASARFVGSDEAPFKVVRPKTNRTTVILQMAGRPASTETLRIGEAIVTVDELCQLDRFSSGHTLRGILGIFGADARPGFRLDADLVDVAPTALHALGLEVPSELAGRALVEAYAEGSWSARPPAFREGGIRAPSLDDPEDATLLEGYDSDRVQERLRDLGYVQ